MVHDIPVGRTPLDECGPSRSRKKFLTLEDGPIGCPKSQQGVTTLCCVTSQKSTNLIYIVEEVLNHTNNLSHKILQPTTAGV